MTLRTNSNKSDTGMTFNTQNISFGTIPYTSVPRLISGKLQLQTSNNSFICYDTSTSFTIFQNISIDSETLLEGTTTTGTLTRTVVLISNSSDKQFSNFSVSFKYASGTISITSIGQTLTSPFLYQGSVTQAQNKWYKASSTTALKNPKLSQTIGHNAVFCHVFENDKIKLYINGTLIRTMPLRLSSSLQLNQIKINKNLQSEDNCIVYNRAFTQDEIIKNTIYMLYEED